ncbi:DUF5801 repeats-in-toxin domain-containing protein, partial [Aestuariicoccus sp. MJ-SS9]|uniref:DUF5801 repeats-in-toxin domain-containing protein n=1 Tax=Aestuariicoccus sp. MJ-SS9 TaxID=3079855 RepID=UPI0029084FF2
MAEFQDTGVHVMVDETEGLQNLETTGETGRETDKDDNDIAAGLVSQLSPEAYSLFTGLGDPIEYALSGYTGAEGDTGQEVFTVTADSENSLLTGLTLTATLDGVPFPVWDGGGFDPADIGETFNSGIDLLDDQDIYLFQAQQDPNLILGVAPDGSVAFGIYMEIVEDENGFITGGKLWTALYEPLYHLQPGADDESDIILDNLVYVSATQATTFDLEGVPSGQNLHITAASSDGGVAIVVTGKNPADVSGGQSLNNWDSANTSKGGGPVTFGSNNQMLTAEPYGGDGLVISFVEDTNPNYTVAEIDPRLDQNEADLESTIQFMVVMTRIDLVTLGLDLSDPIEDGTYTITNSSSEFGDFSWTASGSLVRDLVAQINNSTATSGLSAEIDDATGELLIQSYTGDAITFSSQFEGDFGIGGDTFSTPEPSDFAATEVSFDVVQTQGGDTAVVKITALDRDLLPGDIYADGVKELTTVASIALPGEPGSVDLTPGDYTFSIDIDFNRDGDTDDTGENLSYTYTAEEGDTFADLIFFINKLTPEHGIRVGLIDMGDGTFEAQFHSRSGEPVTFSETFDSIGNGFVDDPVFTGGFVTYDTQALDDIAEIKTITVSGDRGTDEIPDPFTITFYDDGTTDPDSDDPLVYGVSVEWNADGTATVSGAVAGDTITYLTDTPHNQLFIENDGTGNPNDRDTAEFDVGNIVIVERTTDSFEIGTRIKFDDDGPVAVLDRNPEISVELDETVGRQDIDGNPLTEPDRSADGELTYDPTNNDRGGGSIFINDPGGVGIVNLLTFFNGVLSDAVLTAADDIGREHYAISGYREGVVGINSLTDVGTDEEGSSVVLDLELNLSGADLTIIPIAGGGSAIATDLSTTGGDGVYLIEVEGVILGVTGVVTGGELVLDDATNPAEVVLGVAINYQGWVGTVLYTSLYHGDPSKFDEGVDLVADSGTSYINALLTVTDGDDDLDDDRIPIGDAVIFQDDGPVADVTTTGTAVTLDESLGNQE